MATTNLQQWNPTAANQETDAEYAADSQRAGGATDPSVFQAELANKAFYQWSTFLTALFTAFANKGFTTSDSNLNTLTAVCANFLTTADLGFTPVQQGGGAGQGTNKVYIGWSGSRLKAEVDSTDLGNIVFDSELDPVASEVTSLSGAVTTLTNIVNGLGIATGSGWFSIAGIIVQWGVTPVLNPNNSQTFNFNRGFPNSCFGVNVSCMSAAFNQGRTVFTRGWTTTQFTCGANGNDCQIFWIALGN